MSNGGKHITLVSFGIQDTVSGHTEAAHLRIAEDHAIGEFTAAKGNVQETLGSKF